MGAGQSHIIESFDPLTLGKSFKTAMSGIVPIEEIPRLQELLSATEAPL
jgi:hypothetical protein